MSTAHNNSEPEHLQLEAEHEKAPHKMSVMGYLVILFGVAFLLLLMSFFMQQRSNEQAVEGLKQSSVSAMQSVENIQNENKSLRTQVDTQEQEIAALRTKLEEADQYAVDVTAKDWEIICSMDWFSEIQRLYAQGKYTSARARIEEFETSGLAPLLPSGPLHTYDGSDIPSPAERYAEICDKLD